MGRTETPIKNERSSESSGGSFLALKYVFFRVLLLAVEHFDAVLIRCKEGKEKECHFPPPFLKLEKH